MKKQIMSCAAALAAAGISYGASIQFNMGNGTAYSGNNAPAGLADTVWNSVTGDTASGLLYSDGSEAAGVTLDVGMASEAGPGGVADWDNLYGDFRNTFSMSSAPGIFETTLMQYYWFARDYRTLAVRVSGLEAGEYDVYSLVRADNFAITYDVAAGVNSGAWTNLTVSSIAAAAGTLGTNTWAEGLNYTKQRVTVTGTNDYITVMVDSTANGYSPLQGLQLVDTAGLSESSVQVSSLQDRQIVQRSLAGQAVLPIEGTFYGVATEIQARLTAIDGNGTDTDWITIDAAPADGNYAGTLNAAEGWYQLEVRLLDGTDVTAGVTVYHIGVGDIYITCGQSNSANFGSGKSAAEDDRVSYMGLPSGGWKHADDLPENPSASCGSAGAPWPFLGDLLAAAEDVPVGFIVIGDGGSEVYDWTLAANDNYPNLKTAVQSFGTKGFRAVLWHQGERDNKMETSTADYVSRLESVIAQSRSDAGWNIPWVVARASYVDLSPDQDVIDGQWSVITNNPNVFAGPDTDELVGTDPDTGLAYRHDDVHFSTNGLATHAALWFDALDAAFPELVTTGFSISSQAASLAFSGLIGEDYCLEASECLADPDWQAVTDIVSLSESPHAVEIAVTNGTLFYRFRLKQ